jgi:hypothetical protein
MVWRLWAENSFISGSRLVPQSLHFENISGQLCQLYPSKASTVEPRGRREARSGERAGASCVGYMTPAPALQPLYGSRHPPAPHTLRVPQSTLPAVASAREPSACFRFTTAPEPRTWHTRPRNLVLANFPVHATQAPFLARHLCREVAHRPRGSVGSSTPGQPDRPHPGAASPYRVPGLAFPRPARSFSHPAATELSPRAPAPSPCIAFPCR